MHAAAAAGRGEIELAWALLGQRDQLRDGFRWYRRMHQHHVGARRDQADWGKILARIVADIRIERRVDGERAGGDQQRVAVRRALGDLARRNGSAGAATVLDHDGLPVSATNRASTSLPPPAG